MDNNAIKKLEADLWESADLLRANSKITSQQYCMPVLGLIFLRYAEGRYKLAEAEIIKNRPVRKGVMMPIEPSDFIGKTALYLPEQARYSYLVNLPENISCGEAVNHAMELVEAQSEQLKGILPNNYTIFSDELLSELLRILIITLLMMSEAMLSEEFMNIFSQNLLRQLLLMTVYSLRRNLS